MVKQVDDTSERTVNKEPGAFCMQDANANKEVIPSGHVERAIFYLKKDLEHPGGQPLAWGLSTVKMLAK